MEISKENTDSSRRLQDVTDKSSLPRERALQHGFASLSDAEIMAILLGTGTKGKNVLDLSAEILLTVRGHLSELMRMNAREITQRFSGIGPGKALTLLAALELGRRAAQDAAELNSSRESIRSSSQSYELMRHKLQNLDHEEFWVMLLNNSLKRITEVKINEGAVNFTVVEVRKIIKNMIDHGANKVILFHNHPSGQLRPSPQDDALTKKICEAVKIFDFAVLDHIVITPSEYYSYSDNGRLN